MQDEPQVDHLQVRRDGAQILHPTLGIETHLSSLWERGTRRRHGEGWDSSRRSWRSPKYLPIS